MASVNATRRTAAMTRDMISRKAGTVMRPKTASRTTPVSVSIAFFPVASKSFTFIRLHSGQ